MIVGLAMTMTAAANVADRPDGRSLRPASQCFEIVNNSEVIGYTTQLIEQAWSNGHPAWKIVIHQKLANGRFDLRDEVIVRKSDLRPISLVSTRSVDRTRPGWQVVRIRYKGDQIHGTRETAAGVQAINVSATGPVWDGNLWGVTFAALPLANGRQFGLPTWQYDKGFGKFIIKVVGEETVQTDTGAVDVWLIDAGASSDSLVRYRIEKTSRTELGYTAGTMAQRLAKTCP